MRRIRNYFSAMLEDIFLNTTNRLSVQLRLFCIAAGIISVIMTALNCIRAEYMLGLETGFGAVVSVLIYLYASRSKKYLPGSLCIVVIFLGLLTIYVTSGAVEGFAALWFCLYPFICLFVLDLGSAVIFTMIGLAVLAVLLWSPLRTLLPPVYTQNFLLRFPFLYIGNFAFAFALNGFYTYTYNRLLQMNRRFERLSNQDGLTKLANRTYLEKYVDSLLDKGGGRLSAAMVDVDYFKQYNDTYGHLAGDEVLKSIARRIMVSLPTEASIGVRYGGEEFLVLVPDYDGEEAAAFAEALRGGIQDLQIPHTAGDGCVTVSVGVSSRELTSHEGFMELLKQADDALYCIKQNGRNGICVR